MARKVTIICDGCGETINYKAEMIIKIQNERPHEYCFKCSSKIQDLIGNMFIRDYRDYLYSNEEKE